MAIVRFMQSTPGRVLRVVIGAALFGLGFREGSMTGLLLMMVALIPIVTAVANICPMADARDALTRAGQQHSTVPRR